MQPLIATLAYNHAASGSSLIDNYVAYIGPRSNAIIYNHLKVYKNREIWRMLRNLAR
jgi:hypothetical protein